MLDDTATPTRTTRRTGRRRARSVAALLALTAVTATGCVIDLPDGAIPGRTGCQLIWLEPDRLGPQSPAPDPNVPGEPGVDDPRGLAGIFLGIASLVPFPICSG